MDLMQHYVKEDEVIGIDDLHRWHPSSEVVAFPLGSESAAQGMHASPRSDLS
ncbi:hypothetical protein H2204_001287 [Knufia peltigerae]|uniref:Uncharacterized protein n=1 Tax=Knufia peltigerae TaxID=1002370 RepID=A0AA38YD03_9EURO|nr:hypothetical protein H2204_001287 [Knufia peltigerae]